ncbi:MAG: peptidoglycan bridge formation glycyltransferase FemA/FemB family protein [Clostridiaceae bacterium]
MVMKDIYFQENYGKLYEKIEQGFCQVFEFKISIGTICHMFIKRQIPLLIDNKIYFDLVTPYGYGGPVITECKEGCREELVQEFNVEFQKYCRGNNIVSEFVRFHPIVKNAQDFVSCYDVNYMRNTLGTNLTYEDPYKSEFSKGCRRKVRKVIEKGVTYEISKNPEDIDIFKKIYYSTMDRKNADKYYYFGDDYFKQCFKMFGENIIFVKAIYKEQPIAISLNFICNNTIHVHLSGTLSEFLYLSPSYLLKYAVAIWGKENGYKLIHYGGGKSNAKDDSLYLYKKQFCKNTEFEFYTGKKIWNTEVYNELCKSTGSLKDSEFFPAYRNNIKN